MSKRQPVQGHTILVVEDFEATRELISTWLKMCGYHVVEQDRGQACDSCDSAYALQRFRIKTIS